LKVLFGAGRRSNGPTLAPKEPGHEGWGTVVGLSRSVIHTSHQGKMGAFGMRWPILGTSKNS
jgi:hypothetical protein